jgi:hypothetical protein
MDEQFEQDLRDGNPTYLWTADTLDQETARAMTLEESEAEMKRLQIRASRRSRRPTHRLALKAGAARLAPRLRGTEEPDLAELAGEDIPPSASHPGLDREVVEAKAMTYVRYAELSPAGVWVFAKLTPVGAGVLGVYLDLVSTGEIPQPALGYEFIRAGLAGYVALHATDPALLALRNTSTTLALMVGGAA